MTSVSGQAADGERHVDDRVVVLVDLDAVDEAEVDDVDPELGVDDVAHGLLDVGRGRRGRRRGGGGGLGRHRFSWGA